MKSTLTRSRLLSVPRIVIIFVILTTVVLSLYNIQFIRPTADDYTYTIAVQGKTTFQFIKQEYAQWTGRFTTQFWYSIIYRLVGPHAEHIRHANYWLWPLTLILVLVISLHRYMLFLCKRNSDLIDRNVGAPFYLTVTILFLYMILTHVGAVWYNISISVGYQLASIHVLLNMIALCSIVYRMYRTKGQYWQWRQIIALSVLAISGFCATGYNESVALVSLLFYGVGLLWSLLHYRKSMPVWGVVIVMAIIGGIISYVAPGNKARISLIASTTAEQHRGVLAVGGHLVSQSLYGTARFLGTLGVGLFVLSRLPFTKQYLSLYTRLFDRFIHSSKVSFRRIVILAYLSISTIMLLPQIYAQGGIGAIRGHANLQFWLVIGFGLFWASVRSTQAYHKLENRFSRFLAHRMRRAVTMAISYGAVALIIFTSVAMQFDSFRDRLPISQRLATRIERLFFATVYNTFQDALYIGPRYKQAGIALNMTLQRARAHDEVAVPPLCPRAKSLAPHDERISVDTHGYPNSSLSNAFGIAALRLDPNLYCYNRYRLVYR